MLDNAGKLGKILIGMNKALGEIPVTVKLRTGVKDGRNTAHKLMPRLASEWNAGCISVSHPSLWCSSSPTGFFRSTAAPASNGIPN